MYALAYDYDIHSVLVHFYISSTGVLFLNFFVSVYNIISNTSNFSYNIDHPAGDVTRVSVMPRKVTVKIRDAEDPCR